MIDAKRISDGDSYPLGATVSERGVNFAIFSQHAEKVELCLFDSEGKQELQRINLYAKTEDIWHVFVDGIKPGALYGYRVHGPYDPESGFRFNAHKILLDPYAKDLFGDLYWTPKVFAYNTESEKKDLEVSTLDNLGDVPLSVVVDSQAIKAKNISHVKPNIPWHKTVIYETHVKGFTKLNFSIEVGQRGTLAGLSQKCVLQYIKSLGVTAIELLPIHSFVDEQFLMQNQLHNYWGYNSLNFFVAHKAYLASGEQAEFRHFVNCAHEMGLEVILDVVYNHTAEGNHLGPTLCYRGIDNISYYSLASHNARFYANDTGCGNTLNIRHPRVLQLVMDSLRYWVECMGVDGFRFDLATVLGREHKGFDPRAAFFYAVKQDPVLAACKFIAEPWDIGPGGYQMGGFPPGWSEWNDRYRDTLRRYWRGDLGMLPEMARRIHGSSDIFEHSGRGPHASINFITSHDGFTLHDLVSYKEKHNEANKENNKDGHQANFSENYGVEGPTEKTDIRATRLRQQKNLLATLILSQGTPLLLAGDEFGRSQQGNNNAYCQDNELNWLDWEAVTKDGQCLQDFTRKVIALRKRFPMFQSPMYIHRPDEHNTKDVSSVRWYGPTGEEMREEQWGEPHAHVVACLLENNCFKTIDETEMCLLLLIFSSSEESQTFRLPALPYAIRWRCLLDTFSETSLPDDVYYNTEESLIIPQRSMMLLNAAF